MKFGHLFVGQFPRGLDKKGRVTLPAAYRDQLKDEEAIITKGIDRCLFLFPSDQFEELRAKIRQKGISDPRARKFRRHFFSSAVPVKPDSMGRINIPAYLREYAGLQGDLIVAGNDTYVEIWDAERWNSEQESMYKDDNTGAEMWEELGI